MPCQQKEEREKEQKQNNKAKALNVSHTYVPASR